LELFNLQRFISWSVSLTRSSTETSVGFGVAVRVFCGLVSFLIPHNNYEV
jgi:hypothetical protein